MTPGARISSVNNILDAFASELRPLDRICDGYFRARRFIGSGDRRFISDLVYKIMRNQKKLDWWLGKGDVILPVNPRHRIIAALVILERWKDADIASAFSGEKYACDVLDDAERAWIARWIKSPPNILADAMDDASRLECPEWVMDEIQKTWPSNWVDVLQSMQTEASVDLRVNILRMDRDTAFDAIMPMLPEMEKTPFSPWGLRLKQRANLGNLEQLRDGTVEVQDEGSQLIALLCDAKPGMRVMDFCAGAGGKTLALAAIMQNKGRITACDNNDTRLKKSVDRFRRAGVYNHELKLLDNDGMKWLSRQGEKFDRVLCDVPCSGTGTWRRNPDMRHSFTPNDLQELIEVQKNILQQAAPLVKPDGLLVYSTCSMLNAENDSQIDLFLQSNPDFVTVDISALLPGVKLPADKGYLRLNPADHGTDGFFAAVLRKRAK